MSKHLKIAHEKGLEAGFEALVEYLTTPVGSKNPNVQAFIDKIDGLPFEDAVQVYAETYFADDEDEPEDEPTTRVVSIRKVTKATAKTGSKRTTKAQPARKTATRVATSCITAGEAWVALGGQADFEPKDHDKPANNGQLYRLNATGSLVLSN